jgi:hypothetical protein
VTWSWLTGSNSRKVCWVVYSTKKQFLEFCWTVTWTRDTLVTPVTFFVIFCKTAADEARTTKLPCCPKWALELTWVDPSWLRPTSRVESIFLSRLSKSRLDLSSRGNNIQRLHPNFNLTLAGWYGYFVRIKYLTYQPIIKGPWLMTSVVFSVPLSTALTPRTMDPTCAMHLTKTRLPSTTLLIYPGSSLHRFTIRPAH